MSDRYKIVEQRLYTVTVYYEADGTEVARDNHNDDHLWDDNGREPVSDEEVDDFYPIPAGTVVWAEADGEEAS